MVEGMNDRPAGGGEIRRPGKRRMVIECVFTDEKDFEHSMKALKDAAAEMDLPLDAAAAECLMDGLFEPEEGDGDGNGGPEAPPPTGPTPAPERETVRETA